MLCILCFLVSISLHFTSCMQMNDSMDELIVVAVCINRWLWLYRKQVLLSIEYLINLHNVEVSVGIYGSIYNMYRCT